MRLSFFEAFAGALSGTVAESSGFEHLNGNARVQRAFGFGDIFERREFISLHRFTNAFLNHVMAGFRIEPHAVNLVQTDGPARRDAEGVDQIAARGAQQRVLITASSSPE